MTWPPAGHGRTTSWSLRCSKGCPSRLKATRPSQRRASTHRPATLDTLICRMLARPPPSWSPSVGHHRDRVPCPPRPTICAASDATDQHSLFNKYQCRPPRRVVDRCDSGIVKTGPGGAVGQPLGVREHTFRDDDLHRIAEEERQGAEPDRVREVGVHQTSQPGHAGARIMRFPTIKVPAVRIGVRFRLRTVRSRRPRTTRQRGPRRHPLGGRRPSAARRAQVDSG